MVVENAYNNFEIGDEDEQRCQISKVDSTILDWNRYLGDDPDSTDQHFGCWVAYFSYFYRHHYRVHYPTNANWCGGDCWVYNHGLN